MHVLLDHLTAILVGAALLVAGLYVQQRGRQHAIEAAVHGNVQAQTVSTVDVLERDLENMRTDREAAYRLGLDTTRSYTRVVRDGATGTTLLQFPTLANPGDPTDAVIVAYRREWTGRSVRVGQTDREVYRLVRYAYDGASWRVGGGAAADVIRFDAALLDRAGTRTTHGTLPRDAPLDRAETAVFAAHAGAARVAGDQAATTRSNAARYAATARLPQRHPNVAPPLPVMAVPPRTLPALPAAPEPPPPPPPPPGLPGNPSGPSGSPSGPSGTPSTPAPTPTPPPPPPPPPPGL